MTVLEVAWVGGEERDGRDDVPPVLAVVRPGQGVDVTFKAAPGSVAEVVYTLDGTRNPLAAGARHLEAQALGVHDGALLFRARIPGQPTGTAVCYTYRARLQDHWASRAGGWVSYVVSEAPTSLDDPRFALDAEDSLLRPRRPAFPSPADWRGRTIYHLFVDRFCDGDPSNNRLHYAGYDPARADGAHGGDLVGLTAKLDYIRGMGFDTLWLNPVMQNWHAYHGFNICNFLDVDRRLGTIAELRRLVDEAHHRGMWVVLGLVTQHMAGELLAYGDDRSVFRAEGHPVDFAYRPGGSVPLPLPTFFRQSGQGAGPLRTFGRFHRYGLLHQYDDQGAPLSEAEVGDLFGLSDLTTERPEVREAMARIAAYWIAQTDIDGFRLDAVKHAELGFWQDFCPRVRAFARQLGKERFLLFGEFLSDQNERIGLYTGTRAGGPPCFDGMEAYPWHFAARACLRQGQPTGLLSAEAAKAAAAFTHPELNVTFLDNHDQPRFLDGVQGSPQDAPARLRVALAHLLLSPGLPAVYYGTEQGFNGGRDHKNREDMFHNAEWSGDGVSEGVDSFDPTHPFYRFLRHLHQLRQAHPALQRGGWQERWNDGGTTRGVYAFSRLSESEEVVVTWNVGGDAVTLRDLALPGSQLLPGAALEDALSEADSRPHVGLAGQLGRPTVSLHLPALSVQVWVPVPSE